MNNVIKIKTDLSGPIPQRFNSVDDANLKIPKLFEYELWCDTSVTPNRWHIKGHAYINCEVVPFSSVAYSKGGAVLYYLSKTPKMHIVQ